MQHASAPGVPAMERGPCIPSALPSREQARQHCKRLISALGSCCVQLCSLRSGSLPKREQSALPHSHAAELDDTLCWAHVPCASEHDGRGTNCTQAIQTLHHECCNQQDNDERSCASLRELVNPLAGTAIATHPQLRPQRGESVSKSTDVGFASIVQLPADGKTRHLAELRFISRDGPITEAGMNAMLDFMQAFLWLDMVECGFSTCFDLRELRTPSMTLVMRVAEWGCAPERKERWARLNRTCRIVACSGFKFALTQGFLATFFRVCAPTCRTLLLTDPEEPEEGAVCYDPPVVVHDARCVGVAISAACDAERLHETCADAPVMEQAAALPMPCPSHECTQASTQQATSFEEIHLAGGACAEAREVEPSLPSVFASTCDERAWYDSWRVAGFDWFSWTSCTVPHSADVASQCSDKSLDARDSSSEVFWSSPVVVAGVSIFACTVAPQDVKVSLGGTGVVA